MKQKLNCILLVDDDEATNLLSNLVLIDADCALHVKTQQTAKAALNYISDSAQLTENPNPLPYPDLIFLDILMPGMDGWEFLAEYKHLQNKLPHTPIIILHTSSTDPYHKKKAMTFGEVSEINSKPMTIQMMNSIVGKYFPDYI